MIIAESVRAGRPVPSMSVPLTIAVGRDCPQELPVISETERTRKTLNRRRAHTFIIVTPLLRDIQLIDKAALIELRQVRKSK